MVRIRDEGIGRVREECGRGVRQECSGGGVGQESGGVREQVGVGRVRCRHRRASQHPWGGHSAARRVLRQHVVQCLAVAGAVLRQCCPVLGEGVRVWKCGKLIVTR